MRASLYYVDKVCVFRFICSFVKRFILSTKILDLSSNKQRTYKQFNSRFHGAFERKKLPHPHTSCINTSTTIELLRLVTEVR